MNSVLTNRPRLARRVRLHTDNLTGSPVLLHQESVVVLNQTGYQILRLCDGTKTLGEIVRSLASQYQVPELALSSDVSEYVAAISRKGLVEWM
jgi:pyrroloquinoline quinone biosynthesis protein D